MDEPLSKNRVSKAGKRLRDHVRAGGELGDVCAGHQLEADLVVAQRFRSEFAPPMLKVNVRLRQIIASGNFDASAPTQRHKRLERIIQKLARPNSTDLARIQDIAGLRVIVPSIAEARRLEQDLRKRWSGREATEIRPSACRDYIAEPKSNGYRAIHLITERDARLVELQIRTANQQFWADCVERVSDEIGAELKSAEGPPEVEEFFIEAGEMVARLDAGDTFSATLSLILEGRTIMTISVDE